jgi:Ca-activated chloride channel family protein
MTPIRHAQTPIRLTFVGVAIAMALAACQGGSLAARREPAVVPPAATVDLPEALADVRSEPRAPATPMVDLPPPAPPPAALPAQALASAPMQNAAKEQRAVAGDFHMRVAAPAAADREHYATLRDSGVFAAAEQPFSTFSVDVDTGSYANVRRLLNSGRLPPPDAVRVEEMINYFPYHHAEPAATRGRRAPFGVGTEVATTPWNPDTLLLRVGIKAFDQARATLPPANLVFLVDVSGSMDEPDKLPLLKNALRLLVDQLKADDHVSLVTYASGTRVVLEPTSGRERGRIRAAIDQLAPGGSTAGAAGIQLAYQMARQGYLQDGINRILLATDGDFNVGITDFAQLKGMVEEQRKSGVSLSTLGFGVGNYDEERMEQMADAGDGNYSYIDTLNEAQKVLVEEGSSTLSIVARDVKVQMEFNPAVVAEYRLIGYENRALAREDFRNDKVDAGEVGAGHSVTALYEVSLVGKPGLLGEARYGHATSDRAFAGHADELGMLRLRYKTPDGTVASEIATPVSCRPAAASEDLRFAAAVAAFGQQLRGGKYLGTFSYHQVESLAAGARGEDRFGYRGEFLRLVRLASALGTQSPVRVGRVEPMLVD